MGRVAILMGSKNDLPTMQAAIDVLREFEVPHEARVLSAHRAPDAMLAWARDAPGRGVRAIIAGAGGAAHLPGMLAAVTTVPVLGVPIAAGTLGGLDALLSIVQMPRGVPVATFAVGGSANAALFAVQMFAAHDPVLATRLHAYRARRAAEANETLA